MNWSLPQLLGGLHNDIQRRLHTSRETFGHPGTKGDASENIWLQLLNTYLPKRYQAEKAHVVDSKGNFSGQIDVVIFDRQYSPFIFQYEGQTIIPAESVYAVFESKQSINSEMVRYSQENISSVRRLLRTSLPIPHAGGTYPAEPPISILGGILFFESDWSPKFGDPLIKVLNADSGDGRIDIGCVAAHGYFTRKDLLGSCEIHTSEKSATAFLFKLISMLQFSGTVPMIDIEAYSYWLSK